MSQKHTGFAEIGVPQYRLYPPRNSEKMYNYIIYYHITLGQPI